MNQFAQVEALTDDPLTPRERELFLRDLKVRTSKMALMADHQGLIERNEFLTEREKELLLRDLSVRTAKMELTVLHEDLIQQNQFLTDREKKLLLRDLEVRSSKMELMARQQELVSKNEQLNAREKELLIRDLGVRSSKMELMAQQEELIRMNKRLNDREKELLIRDLEVRGAKMQLNVEQKELLNRNQRLTDRQTELVMRDLEVRSAKMELQATQRDMLLRTQELENLLTVIRLINKEDTMEDLLHALLRAFVELIPNAERGALLRYNTTADVFQFNSCEGFDFALIRDLRFKPRVVLDSFLHPEQQLTDGFYLITRFEHDHLAGALFRSERPRSELVMTIYVDDKLEGVLFLENFSEEHAFDDLDLAKLRLFREHAMSAFGKLALLSELRREHDHAKQAIDELNGRNQEMHLRKIELLTAQEELRATQEQLITTEKMAALGQLVHNLTHEVNTPIAAMSASAVGVLGGLPPLVAQLPVAFRNMTPAAESQFFQLMASAIQAADHVTIAEERARRAQVAEQLAELNIPGDRDKAARSLVKLGVTTDLDRFAALLFADNSPQILETAAALARLRRQMAQVLSAVSNVQRTMQSYSHFADEGRLGIKGPISLRDSIEEVLRAYRLADHDAYQILTVYDPELHPVPGRVDQLKLVWNNLIHNALQAMPNGGTLELAVHDLGDAVEVSITDAGAGISERVRHRLFDPFFTTRKAGEGSGLGLFITKKIVEEHEGAISFTTEPGRTTFVVRLPYDAA